MIKIDDNTEFRKGDILLIRAKVRYAANFSTREYMSVVPVNLADPEEYFSDVMIPTTAIAGIETRVWAPEETASYLDGNVRHEVTVIATHGKNVWVQFKDGATTITSANALTPIPEEPEEAASSEPPRPAAEVEF